MREQRILIVEDNVEIRESLKDILELHEFLTETASDGQEAITVLDKVPIDLVISDIMMPNKDGYEMVKEIKSQKRYSHIPIIFLTARVLTSDKLTGLELGANDYITKPFEMNELLLKVKNLLALKESVTESAYTHPPKISVVSKKESFLKRLNLAIESEIANPNFVMNDLAHKLEISPSSLQKKLKSMASKSVSQYIREYRLDRAKYLIDNDYGSLSEISKATGFRSLSYFSKSYKNYFGTPPSKNA